MFPARSILTLRIPTQLCCSRAVSGIKKPSLLPPSVQTCFKHYDYNLRCARFSTKGQRNPWKHYMDTHFIHEEAFELVRISLSLNPLPVWTLTVEEAREQERRLEDAIQDDYVFHGREEEIVVPSPFSPSGIPVTVYKPDSAPKTPAILVYIHGGGMVMGSREGCHSCLRRIASQSGAIIVSVGYRLLPNPSPHAPMDDSAVATQWVMNNKVAVGGRSESCVGVSGDSAGGTIATTVTGEVEGVAFLLLIYPMSDLSFSQKSYQEFERVPGMNKLDVDWLNKHALYDSDNSSVNNVSPFLSDPRRNNMIRSDLEMFPPTLILLANLDPVRDVGLEFAAKLAASGVNVESEVYEGIPHGFFMFPTVFRTNCEKVYGRAARFISQFHGTVIPKA